MEKIVITGMGAVTPIGIGTNAYWDALIHSKCGVGPITLFDARELPVQIAAEVRDFAPEKYIPKPLYREMDRFMQFAYVAAEEAMKNSCLCETGSRIGIVMGSAMNGTAAVARTQEAVKETCRVRPRFVPMVLGNIAAAQIAIAHHIHGPSLTVNTACSAGGDAILTAAMLLRAGEAETVLAVSGESILCPIVVSSLAQAKALSRRNTSPQHASRPFDLERDGFVIGEGGGAMLLETEQHAKARGAEILAELSGWANTTDGYHVTAPQPDGMGAAICIERALERAGLTPSEIGYINAHGTSTMLGDRAETQAVKRAFGKFVPPISSTKGATGHLMGAGGITEAIACVMALRTGILPPTLNYSTPDPLCDLDYIPNAPRQVSIQAAMSNSLGFGGQNNSLIFTKYQK